MANKTGKTVGAGVWIGVIVVLLMLVVGGVAWMMYQDKQVSDAPTSAETTILELSSKSEFCANNPSLDLKVRILNTLQDSSVAYMNGTLYVKNLDTGSVVESAVTSGATSAFTTISDVFDCASVKGYEIYVKGDGTAISDDMIKITPAMLVRDPIELTIEAGLYTSFKVKGYDNNDRTKIRQTSDNSTDYVVSLTSTFYENDATVFDGTADKSIDVVFTLQPNATNKAKGTGLIIAVNTEDESNINDWDETTIIVEFDGVELSEVDLSANEIKALSAYERVFMVPDTIGMKADGSRDTESTIRFYVSTESGQTSDFDPVIKLVALGDYQSNKDPSIVLTGIGFKDDTSRTELYSAQTITLNNG